MTSLTMHVTRSTISTIPCHVLKEAKLGDTMPIASFDDTLLNCSPDAILRPLHAPRTTQVVKYHTDTIYNKEVLTTTSKYGLIDIRLLGSHALISRGQTSRIGALSLSV